MSCMILPLRVIQRHEQIHVELMDWMRSKLTLEHLELGWAEIPFTHASFSLSTIEVDRFIT